MAFSNKLHNPTPFNVKFNYHKGIDISIPAFSHIDLPMEYVEDFVKGRPGSESVYSEIEFYGVFLEDPNRSYEDQAVGAINAAARHRETMVKEVTDNIRKSITAMGGQPSQEVIDEQLDLSGVKKLRGEVEELKSLSKMFDKVLQTQAPKSSIKAFDLEKTILVLDPPKEFPTKEAMNYFLSKNPDIRAAHERYSNQQPQLGNNPDQSERRGPGRPRKEEVVNE